MAAHNNQGYRARGASHGGRGSSGNDPNGNTRRFNLPEMTGKFDRYCCWCGAVIGDCALERLGRCSQNRCYRVLPVALPGRRRADGLQRCARCYCLSHRSFLFCELCGRQRTAADVYGAQMNLNGVDMAIAGGAAGGVAGGAVVAGANPPLEDQQAAIPPPQNDDWANEGGDFFNNNEII